MGSNGPIGDRLGNRVRDERERRRWTQQQLAEAMTERHVTMHWTTIAKIERADRAVKADELDAFADLFGVSTDALLGRHDAGTDAMWAVSKLAANAQKVSSDLLGLHQRLVDDLSDVCLHADREGRTSTVRPLVDLAVVALGAINTAREKAADVGDEFPLPGVKFG